MYIENVDCLDRGRENEWVALGQERSRVRAGCSRSLVGSGR